jgi:hypothetical protein
MGAMVSSPRGAASASHRDACAALAHLSNVGPKVRITRNGVPLNKPSTAMRGDVIHIADHGSLVMQIGPSRYIMYGGDLLIACKPLMLAAGHAKRLLLAPELRQGRLRVVAASGPAAAITADALAVARHRHSAFLIARRHGAGTEVTPKEDVVEMASLRLQRLRIRVRRAQTGKADRRGLRLDIYPFAVSPLQRPVRSADDLPAFWDDGRTCSVGCHQPGGSPGWPLQPFHRQHALRSGLNELRPSGMHVGIDIEARDGQEAYPMSSGRAHLLRVGTVDEAVQVGQLAYWHIRHEVSEGQYVTAYQTRLGRVRPGFRHLHLSEIVGGEYLNPLRPGGSNLSPWSDTEPPVIGVPQIVGGGRVIVSSFDPQSFVDLDYQYHTPVLAPAALAWRLYDGSNRSMTPLEWALRGSHHLPDSWKSRVYAPGATNPGFWCFIRRKLCKPVWRYWLAGGLTPALPVHSLVPGHPYRLTVYAEDWAGNRSALDYKFRWSSRYLRMVAPSSLGAPTPRYDG